MRSLRYDNLAWFLALLLIPAACCSAAKGEGDGEPAVEPGLEISGFRAPEYGDDGEMLSQIFGDHARMLGEGMVEIRGLRIEFYRGGGTAAVVEAPHCRYDRDRERAFSDGRVRIELPDAVIRGTRFVFERETRRFRITDGARVTLNQERLGLNGGKTSE
ncbi:hypothetical protein [Kiritimatiella glycovorans]|uniref:Organic solvent tolerance-like N-terminal domain-containing protein n=1 Tax=Kiritimatiella glycovorans TaxID=1307763 RepID=A0A0G3ECM4_9BACT|nr:hypothetical protein [Kiritimatiella glycovorans]AKJ64053.1 hypothetical protein L21SP4_00788 [Kiritimatiella glycovorans]